MIYSIVEAIKTALDTEFGYKVYTEEDSSTLKKPNFFVSCIESSMELFQGSRYLMQNKFCIRYYPSTQNKIKECYDIAERLNWCLEHITIDANELIRGKKIWYEVKESALSYNINFDSFLYRVEEKEVMEEFAGKTIVEEGGTIG